MHMCIYVCVRVYVHRWHVDVHRWHVDVRRCMSMHLARELLHLALLSLQAQLDVSDVSSTIVG